MTKMYDYGIEGGNVYIDGSFHRLNLYTKGEKIGELTQEELPCRERVDARGKYVLPGFIDPHVHFSLGVGANISKDDFETGSREAALGGVTTYIDFLDPVKTASDIPYEFEKRSRLASKSVVDYSFHTTIANPTDAPEKILEESLKVGINSVKLFTTYADTDRRTYDDYIFKLLKASSTGGGIVVVHAEHDDLIDKSRDILVRDHENSRPSITENIEVMNLAIMCRATGGRLYIVHCSAGSSVELLLRNFAKELDSHQITLESCPHYFLLNTKCLEGEDGYKFTMTPPIRPEDERRLLVENMDLISTIGTDHCPYTKEQKNHKYTSEIPMGIGGIRYSFLNMYTLAGFSILDKFTEGPARAYGLTSKGSLRPDMDADIVIFDPLGETTVEDEMSVYNRKKYKGAIWQVFSRGSVCVEKGELVPHTGKYISRKGL